MCTKRGSIREEGVFLPDSARGGELGQSRRHFMRITPPRKLASSIRRRVGGVIGVIGCQNCVSHGRRRGSANSRLLLMTRCRDEGRDPQRSLTLAQLLVRWFHLFSVHLRRFASSAPPPVAKVMPRFTCAQRRWRGFPTSRCSLGR